eukprot:jgi/Orpsp1_1/1189409/evm.model.d7180000071843.1
MNINNNITMEMYMNNKITIDGEDFYIPTELCKDIKPNTVISNILGKFNDSSFYTNFLQFFLIALMYFNIGKGKYWTVLFYGSIAGFIGKVIEDGTIAYVCSEGVRDLPRKHIITFLITEVCWIAKEFSVPFLNLIKIKIFADGKYSVKYLNFTIYILFVTFCGVRTYIGIERMTNVILENKQIMLAHMLAYGIMGFADLICTCGIIYIVNRNNKEESYKSNKNQKFINHYIEKSSYIILVLIDIVSIILALLSGFIYDNKEIRAPFLCFKSSFLLILACDSLIFKYKVTYNSFDINTLINNNGNNDDCSPKFISRNSSFCNFNDNTSVHSKVSNINNGYSSNNRNNASSVKDLKLKDYYNDYKNDYNKPDFNNNNNYSKGNYKINYNTNDYHFKDNIDNDSNNSRKLNLYSSPYQSVIDNGVEITSSLKRYDNVSIAPYNFTMVDYGNIESNNIFKSKNFEDNNRFPSPKSFTFDSNTRRNKKDYNYETYSNVYTN